MAEVAVLEPAMKRSRLAEHGVMGDCSRVPGAEFTLPCSSRSHNSSGSAQSVSASSTSAQSVSTQSASVSMSMPMKSTAVWPTPPESPTVVGHALEDLPPKLLAKIFSQSRLDVIDRVRLQLCSRRIKQAVDCAYGSVRRLRVANTESEDDRLSSSFILRSIRKCSNLRSLTLCLSSSVNDDLCKGSQLFQVLGNFCPLLTELTLLLTQLRIACLNEGLLIMGQQMLQRQRSLIKLSLVNSVADATTVRLIAQWHSNLESVGLVNCWYVTDQMVAYLGSKLNRLRTLNVSGTRQVTHGGVQKVINQCALRRQHIKLYISKSSARPDQLLYEDGRVAISDPKSAVRRKRTNDGRLLRGVDLTEDAARPEWGEYDSDGDFD